MARPKCGVCEGSGEVETLTFSTPRRLVKRTCSHCHGRGTVAYKVDLYEIVEWLRGLPHEEYSASGLADRIEKLEWVPPQAKEKEHGRHRPGGIAVRERSKMSAELREREAWENRYKHGKASRTWAAIADEHEASGKLPTPAECRILADWMAAYEEADANAEAAFRALTVATQPEGDDNG